MTKVTQLKTEVILKEHEQDMIDFILDSGMQRATLFKKALRDMMNRKKEEEFDERVKRLLNEVIAERGANPAVIVDEVKPKKRLGFGSMKISADTE